ncbi:MAG TPA: FMN-binding protein [Polyangia bacterium]|nr:FMN-binding protein [Polyangia bacterium]
MKIVFNFKIVKALATVAALSIGLAAAPARADGVYFSTRDLLNDFFRSSKTVTYKKVAIGPAERARLTARLGYAPARDSYTFFVASTGDHVDGYAIIDEEKGEHLPITFAVKLSPTGVVERQEIVAYREPRGDEVRDDRFRKQFVGKSARDQIAADCDIVAISGATISSRAMAVGVKRVVVLFDVLMTTPGPVAQVPLGRM